MAGAEPTFQSKPEASSSVAFMLRALKYRNYRLFFGGQIVSLTGTWITTTATSWLVYRITGSALLLGLVGFASQFPAFLLTPFAGIFVDRWNRHRLLVATQTLSMLTSFALASAARRCSRFTARLVTAVTEKRIPSAACRISPTMSGCMGRGW